MPAAMLHYALAMASRGRAAGAAGAVVILGAVGSALINEVGHGWQWWAGAGAAVLAAAGLTFWLALRPTGGEGAGDRLVRYCENVQRRRRRLLLGSASCGEESRGVDPRRAYSAAATVSASTSRPVHPWHHSEP